MANQTAKMRTRFLAFLGLSRFQQAVPRLAEPAFVAVVAAKAVPDPMKTYFAIAVGLVGYMALFAANDLLDINIDRTRYSQPRRLSDLDLDSAVVNHPLAGDYLSFAQGAIWMISLAVLTLIGAYLLSPISAVLFVAAGLLQVIYCKLAKITPFKFLPAGMFVAVGALAGWFAVMPTVDIPLLAALFVWIYGWEVGGRNILNDWSDMEEDSKAGIKTVPVVYGRRTAMWLIMFHLGLSVIASFVVGYVSLLNPVYFVLAFIAGNYLMLGPGLRFVLQPKPEAALFLFKRANLYPPIMFIGLVASIYLPI